MGKPKHQHFNPIRMSPVVREALMTYAKEQGEDYSIQWDVTKMNMRIISIAVQQVCQFAGHRWRQVQALQAHLAEKGLTPTGRTQVA